MRIRVSNYVADKLDGTNAKDFKLETFKGSGPGGQHRNKRETAVRITHIATGITAEATDRRSQSQNRMAAFRKLAIKLIKHYSAEELNSRREESASKGTLRTYNEQRETVKDHLTGAVADYASTLDGDIDGFIEARLSHDEINLERLA